MSRKTSRSSMVTSSGETMAPALLSPDSSPSGGCVTPIRSSTVGTRSIALRFCFTRCGFTPGT
jgi:hypothetical protein